MSLRAVSVKVNSQNPTNVGQVVYDNSISVKVNDQQDYKVKSASLATLKLSGLTDVYVGNPQDGNSLVYDSASQTYIVRQLTSSDINISNIDGGLF